MPNITENRINTVMPKLVVYRIAKSEIDSTNIVTITGTDNSENTGYLQFSLRNNQGNTTWVAFKEWWKKNNNLIILGCMVKNIDTGQNKGYYWCPTNRTPNPLRTDEYTKFLEFIIQRKDNGIFYDNGTTIYEFYFINLTH